MLKIDLWVGFDGIAVAAIGERRQRRDISVTKDDRQRSHSKLQIEQLRDFCAARFDSLILSCLRRCREAGLKIQGRGPNGKDIGLL